MFNMKDRPGLLQIDIDDHDHMLTSPEESVDPRTSDAIQLTFITKEDTRWLNAGNAARNRQPIFTGTTRLYGLATLLSNSP